MDSLFGILWFLFFIQIPETFRVFDQFEHSQVFSTRPKSEQWVLFGADSRSVRVLAKWVNQMRSEFFKEHPVFCFVDITDMPEKIKQNRFLPRIKASEILIYVIDGQAGFDWVPRKKGHVTLIHFTRLSDPDFEFIQDPKEVQSLMK